MMVAYSIMIKLNLAVLQVCNLEIYTMYLCLMNYICIIACTSICT